MNATVTEQESEADATLQTPQQLMLLARRLDTIGRQTEEFLIQQLDQLERAIKEFESEKSAWRRQLRRESDELATERDEIQRLQDANSQSVPGTVDAVHVTPRTKRDLIETAARKSGPAPLRLLIQPGNATTMQVGLLLFEISKLNRDLGGRGLRFEIDDVRVPKKRLLARMTRADGNREILELTAFPTLPLSGRGTHVVLDVDLTDRLEDWIMFKSHLLRSTLVNTDLEQIFRYCKSVKNHRQTSCVVKEAALRADGRRSQITNQSDYPSSVLWGNSAIDAIQQQVARMENCCEQLSIESGLFIHVELHPMAKDTEQVDSFPPQE